MVDGVGGNSFNNGVKPAGSGLPPGPSAPVPKAPKIERDSFMRGAPTAAQLAAARDAVAALDRLPAPPADVAGKQQWLLEVKPVFEAAKIGAANLDSARFFQKAVPEDQTRAAQAKVDAFETKMIETEVAAGLREPAPPPKPFALTGFMARMAKSNNPLAATVGALGLMPAAALDTVVTGAEVLQKTKPAPPKDG